MQTDPISNSTNASLTLASRGMINNVNIAFVPRQVVDTSNPSTFVNNKEPNPSTKVSISSDALSKLSSEQQSYELPATKARAYSCGFLFQRTLHN